MLKIICISCTEYENGFSRAICSKTFIVGLANVLSGSINCNLDHLPLLGSPSRSIKANGRFRSFLQSVRFTWMVRTFQDRCRRIPSQSDPEAPSGPSIGQTKYYGFATAEASRARPLLKRERENEAKTKPKLSPSLPSEDLISPPFLSARVSISVYPPPFNNSSARNLQLDSSPNLQFPVRMHGFQNQEVPVSTIWFFSRSRSSMREKGLSFSPWDMNNENVFQTPIIHTKGITREQRARITQNFRAAKARLACKRPCEATEITRKFVFDLRPPWLLFSLKSWYLIGSEAQLPSTLQRDGGRFILIFDIGIVTAQSTEGGWGLDIYQKPIPSVIYICLIYDSMVMIVGQVIDFLPGLGVMVNKVRWCMFLVDG